VTTATTLPTALLASPTVPVAALMAASDFDNNVTAWGVLPNSDAIASTMASYEKQSSWVNTQPMYYAPLGAPLVAMNVSPGCNNFVGVGPGEVPSEVPMPSEVNLNGSSDNPLIIYSSLEVYELWQVSEDSPTSYSACWGGAAPLASFTGVFNGTFGMSASGISYAATIISENDVKSGAIRHAIAVELPYCDGYVAPAVRGDCANTGDPAGAPAEGQWFRFAPGTTCGSACNNPFADLVFQAISTYGMVVTDNTGGSCAALVMEQPSDWAAQGYAGEDPITAALDGAPVYSVVAGLPWGDLQAISPVLGGG